MSLARAPGTAYTTWLCIFVALGLSLSVPVRAAADPITAINGSMLVIVFGVAVIVGQFTWPIGKLWVQASLRH